MARLGRARKVENHTHQRYMFPIIATLRRKLDSIAHCFKEPGRVSDAARHHGSVAAVLILRSQPIRTAFNAGNYWRRPLLPGLMILFVVLGSFRLLAADGSLLDSLSAPSGTNGSLRNEAALLAASTNVSVFTNASSAGVTNSVETLDDKYKLAVGDRLSFNIIEDEDEPKQLDETDSGD